MDSKSNRDGSNYSDNDYKPDQLPEIDSFNVPSKDNLNKKVSYSENTVQSVGDIIQDSSNNNNLKQPNFSNRASYKKKNKSNKIVLISAFLGIVTALIIIIVAQI